MTYGRFTGPFLSTATDVHAEAFAELWRTQPYRRLKFRYGYPDADGNFHLLVTRRATLSAGARPGLTCARRFGRAKRRSTR